MENPGYVRTGKRQMLKGGISDPRNKALMKMFNMIGIGERARSGVPDIFSVWEQQGWKEPEIVEQYGPDRTILTLSLIKKSAIKNSDKKTAIKISGKKCSTKKTKEKLERILLLMDENREYKTAEIAEKIGLKPARTRELLKILAEEKKVEASGNNRDRSYKKTARN